MGIIGLLLRVCMTFDGEVHFPFVLSGDSHPAVLYKRLRGANPFMQRSVLIVDVLAGPFKSMPCQIPKRSVP
jgi:hypothetical protein